MAHLLFPLEGSTAKASSIWYKHTEIPQQLSYIIRGATDAIGALELFLQLLFESSYMSEHDTHSTSGYLAFDAYVGDTACQLRACMLLDIMEHYRRPKSCAHIAAIRSTISRLEKVLDNATRLLSGFLDLDVNKGRFSGLEALGVPKSGMTLDELIFRLESKDTGRPLLIYESSSASSQESLASMTSSQLSSNSTDELCRGSSISPDESFGEHWRPSDWNQTIRFLIYSHVLSKYKKLVACNGIYQEILKPEHALTTGQSLAQRDFGHQFARPNKREIEEEFLSLQRYISGLSCAWLELRARRSWSIQPGLHSLLKSTVRTSAEGISSVSSYMGYIILRSLWAETSAPIIIMTTRFCPSGFHVNYFKVTTHTIPPSNGIKTRPAFIPTVSWELTRLIGKGYTHFRCCLEPHIMISGNSIDGSMSDYLERLPSCYRHSGNSCDDNEKHCSDMLASEQDRVVQAIFADHRHYAFELSWEERLLGEDKVVRRLMDESVPGLSAAWEESRKESVLLGTGSSLKLCMWQHVALESPARFMAHLEGCDRPWVIHDPISGHE